MCAKHGTIFPGNPQPAVLVFALAAAAHQGGSANLFATPGDMFHPSQSRPWSASGAVVTISGVGLTYAIKHSFSLHPLMVFCLASLVYLCTLGVMQLRVSRLEALAIEYV
jgi:ACS family hexuronate transporter-like MFS transporter